MNPDELLLSLPQASLATTQSLPLGSNYQSSSFLPPSQGLSNPSLGFPSLTESQEQGHKVSGENGAENCQPLPHPYFSPQGPTNTTEGAKFPEENLILLQILNGFLSDFPKLPITRNQLMDGKWSLTLRTGSSLELFQAIREASGKCLRCASPLFNQTSVLFSKSFGSHAVIKYKEHDFINSPLTLS